MITVDMLLKMPGLKELKTAAGGSGLGREVRVVSVIDAPDSYKFLKGNELILTSGFMFGGDAEILEQFVTALIESGTSALGIKKERFIKKIPDNVIRVADKHGFPIIEIPYRFVWSDIISMYYELLYTISEKSFAPIDTAHTEQILNAGRWGSGQLIDKITQLFQVPLALLEGDKKIKADNGLPGVKHIGVALENSPLFPENMDNEIIPVGENFITVCKVPFNRLGQPEYLAIMSHNDGFLKEMQRLFHLFTVLGDQDNLTAVDRSKAYRQFIMRIISGKITADEIELFEKYRETGENTYTGAILIVSEDVKEIYNQLTDTYKSARFAKKGKASGYIVENAAKQEAFVLLELEMKDSDENPEIWQNMLFEDINYFLQEKMSGYVSMGALKGKLSDIAESYREAGEAYAMGKILWEDRRCFQYQMVSVYANLYKTDLSQIDLSGINMLESNQAGFTFDGIQTIEAFVERGGYKKAAADLYIHENTLRYRIQKIGDLLHLDMEDPVILIYLIIQIKLWRLIKNKYGN